MKQALQALIFIAASHVLAYRRKDSVEINFQTSGLQAFNTWANENCPDCKSIFGSLIEGVMEAGFLKESSCTWDQHTLRAELDSDQLYGEIASASRVPVMWTLDKTLSFTFSKEGEKIVVTSKGMGTQPPGEGLELYKAVMKEANLKGTDCIDDEDCIAAEIAAAGKYLKSNWKHMQKSDRKVTKVLKTMKKHFAANLAIKAKGEYPKIMYSILTASPNQMTSFVFEAGHVYATTLYEDNTEFHLAQKSQKMGLKSLLNAGDNIKIATSFAKSGMNLAMMMAYGNSDDYRSALQEIGVYGANPKAVANMFSFCKDSIPGQDPTCKGSTPGRVAWSSQLPASMM